MEIDRSPKLSVQTAMLACTHLMRYDREFVQPLNELLPAVLADIVQRQPASPERTAFVWSVVVGPALARVTSVELRDRTLIATARDARWAREIDRASVTILARVRHLLGDGIDRIDVVTE